jgi:predicted aminopeptidase
MAVFAAPTVSAAVPWLALYAKRAMRIALCVWLGISLSACATTNYYGQAISGHLQVLWQAQAVSELLSDPANKLSSEVRAKLAQALRIRAFAIEQLQLPDNGSYRSYADVGRRFVVWNVVAAPEFSLLAKQSCFLIAGCLSYRGFYAQAPARAAAAELRSQGYDVAVGGVRAYSTLGWFADPILNTMLEPPPPYLAGVIFHELAHQQLYIDDDSSFNEAFASAVQQLGVERWYARNAAGLNRAALRAQQARRLAFSRLVLSYRQQLSELYASGVQAGAMRASKAAILDDMRAAYRTLSAGWDNPSAYAGFFDAGLNNARLASAATYLELVPAFIQLARANNGNMRAFYAAARTLGEQPRAVRAQALSHLLEAHRRGTFD